MMKKIINYDLCGYYQSLCELQCTKKIFLCIKKTYGITVLFSINFLLDEKTAGLNIEYKYLKKKKLLQQFSVDNHENNEKIYKYVYE